MLKYTSTPSGTRLKRPIKPSSKELLIEGSSPIHLSKVLLMTLAQRQRMRLKSMVHGLGYDPSWSLLKQWREEYIQDASAIRELLIYLERASSVSVS